MTVAVVVLAPVAVIETATAWARCGLVGNSLWVATDDLTGIDLDTPNAIVATHLRFEHEPDVGTLAVQLAELGSLDEARITWLRGTDATNEPLLRALDELARSILPYDSIHWLDIVVPQRRTDEATAPAAGVWTQFHIHASDRPAPDVADAGWDLGLPVPLHVTLALTGILGGITTTVPWGQLSAARHWVVRVFSRLVDGGLEARRQSWRFVLETLPDTHAALQHESEYLPADPDEADRIVDRAADWLLACQNRALAYTAPPTSELAGRPRLPVGEHLRNFARFIPVALRALFGIRPLPGLAVGHVLEFDDLGYNVGRAVSVTPLTESIPDFAAMETAAVAEARAALDRLRTREGAPASTEVWEPLAQIATSLVDGGLVRLPDWPVPTSLGRQLSLDPGWVSLSPTETVTSTAPELAAAENLIVAAEALSAARTATPPPLGPGAEPDRVTATAVRLTRLGNARDAEELAEQLDEVDPSAAPPPGPRTLLDRVRGRVVGGLLRSRLDAERWTGFATNPPEGSAPVWGRQERRFRRAFWIGVGLCAALAIAWWILYDDITTALDLDVSRGTGLAVIGILALVIALVVVSRLFRSWYAFLERGRRRLEMIALWLDRAARATTAHAELRNVERTSRAWTGLLSGLLRGGENARAGDAKIELDQLPYAMAVGHPRFKPRQMTEWLAQLGARPGWRLAYLGELVGGFLSCPADRAVQQLAQDQALPGGHLQRLTADLPDLTTEWRHRTVSSIWNELRAKITDHSDRLEIPQRRGQPFATGQVETFLAGLTPDDGEGRWQEEYLVPAHAVRPAGDHEKTLLLVSAALSTARIRIQIDPFEGSALPDPEIHDDSGSNDDLPR